MEMVYLSCCFSFTNGNGIYLSPIWEAFYFNWDNEKSVHLFSRTKVRVEKRFLTSFSHSNKEQIEDKEAQASQLSGTVTKVAQLGERRDSLESDHRTLTTTVEALDDNTRRMVEALQAQIDDLTAKVNVLMRAISTMSRGCNISYSEKKFHAGGNASVTSIDRVMNSDISLAMFNRLGLVPGCQPISTIIVCQGKLGPGRSAEQSRWARPDRTGQICQKYYKEAAVSTPESNTFYFDDGLPWTTTLHPQKSAVYVLDPASSCGLEESCACLNIVHRHDYIYVRMRFEVMLYPSKLMKEIEKQCGELPWFSAGQNDKSYVGGYLQSTSRRQNCYMHYLTKRDVKMMEMYPKDSSVEDAM
ncbi:hypothetical protein HHK36_004551 [Tetracentron sinense]|uniref:Uncharacterized protein n=1 Tax=Tetracentron sinense TaxID=13715 RepID=A0A835DTJ7_TETSI|nr:hypothetical protein HHK36_004551 [Tetracentron sinense]